jgi:predicted methyltransferase
MDAGKRWLSIDGPEFIAKIGISAGHTVVDFGCGDGYYTFPSARVVQAEGRVYALDNDELAVQKIKRKAAENLFENIISLLVPENLSLELDEEIADVALLYDVLHYLQKSTRKDVYAELHRLLKYEGLLSVYPKHYRSDSPMWSLADMSLHDIIKEITEMGFRFENKRHEKLFHFHSYTSGYILTFRKLLPGNPGTATPSSETK